MKLIISPAKKMVTDLNDFDVREKPLYLSKTKQLLTALKNYSYDELQALWRTSDKLTEQNCHQLQRIDLISRLTPAILSYTGIQYQSMAPGVLTASALEYLQNHLWILSGFYGILRPFDGIEPYRLEMQAPLAVNGSHNLYDFWGDRLYRTLRQAGDGPIINLASKEYAKAVTPYLQADDDWIDVVFGHVSAGKLKTRATRAKMARGEMVRFIAEHQLTNVDDIKDFDSPNYTFDEELSTKQKLVFIDRNLKK